MTPSELTKRVALTMVVLIVPAALVGAWLGGAAGAVGVLAGGALALVSFVALAARAASATPGIGWMLAAGLRFVAVAAVATALFVAGWAHPVAVVAGYSALPFAAVLQGLRLAREENASWT